MLPSDFNLLVEEEDQFAPLSEEDRRKIKSLQNREAVLRSPNLLRELELMKAADKKAEIQGRSVPANKIHVVCSLKSKLDTYLIFFGN